MNFETFFGIWQLKTGAIVSAILTAILSALMFIMSLITCIFGCWSRYSFFVHFVSILSLGVFVTSDLLLYAIAKSNFNMFKPWLFFYSGYIFLFVQFAFQIDTSSIPFIIYLIVSIILAFMVYLYLVVESYFQKTMIIQVSKDNHTLNIVPSAPTKVMYTTNNVYDELRLP